MHIIYHVSCFLGQLGGGEGRTEDGEEHLASRV